MVLGMSVSNFGPEVQYHGEGLEISVDSDLDPDSKLNALCKSLLLISLFAVLSVRTPSATE